MAKRKLKTKTKKTKKVKTSIKSKKKVKVLKKPGTAIDLTKSIIQFGKPQKKIEDIHEPIIVRQQDVRKEQMQWEDIPKQKRKQKLYDDDFYYGSAGVKNFVYVISAKDEFNTEKTLLISSPKLINFPPGKRNKLYKAVRNKYPSYDFNIRKMKLIMTYDARINQEVTDPGIIRITSKPEYP